VPETNGKTTLCAGLALYFCEFSPQPIEIPVAASSREQAQILYHQAEAFILNSPTLHDPVTSAIQKIRGKLKLVVPRFRALHGLRRVEHCSGSRIQVQAADDRTGDGVIFRLAFIDELHRHRNLDLQRTWVGKIGKIQGAQVVVISTAGEPGGEFELARERIRQTATTLERKDCFVRAESPEVVLHEWAVPENGDVEDLALVKKANPFSRITVKTLASKRRQPTWTLEHWRRFTCNLPTRSGRAAIQEMEWEAARSAEKIPPGVPIWVGLDLAYQWDTTAAVPLWWKDKEFRLLGPAEVLVPPRDGTSMRPHLIQEALSRLWQRNPIHTVVMDSSKGEEMAVWIASELGARVLKHSQSNAQQADDYERFMEGLRTGSLHHSGDQALTDHAMNAVVRLLPASGAKFERSVAGRMNEGQTLRVIDALVAAAMVHSTAVEELGNDYPLLESVY
ncbi:MAG TPA: terminase large subunit, partial [Candidatus Limnocylindria bacterium]|nr:terminase large subunit [Candidatus Limnocylindria bacterium]